MAAFRASILLDAPTDAPDGVSASGGPDPAESPARRAHLLPLFAAGATHTALGAYVVEGRTRVCTGATGCTPWQEDVSAFKPGAAMGWTSVDLVDAGHMTVSFTSVAGATWPRDAPGGAPLDASALASLLLAPAGFTYQGGTLKADCGALKAVKNETIDALRTRETELEARAIHRLKAGTSAYLPPLPARGEVGC